MRNILKEKFNCDADDIIGTKPLFYGDFCNTMREYEQITDMQEVIYSLIIKIFSNVTVTKTKCMLFC